MFFPFFFRKLPEIKNKQETKVLWFGQSVIRVAYVLSASSKDPSISKHTLSMCFPGSYFWCTKYQGISQCNGSDTAKNKKKEDRTDFCDNFTSQKKKKTTNKTKNNKKEKKHVFTAGIIKDPDPLQPEYIKDPDPHHISYFRINR